MKKQLIGAAAALVMLAGCGGSAADTQTKTCTIESGGQEVKIVMTAEDEIVKTCLLYTSCPAKAGDRIHGRPDRASLEKDIIHQDDLFVLYRNGRCRRVRQPFMIVSPVPDIQIVGRYACPFKGSDQRSELIGQMDAAGPDPDEDQILHTLVALNDLMCNSF